jgi:2-polyprenyl-3-methyl-5-hydroxy-6-metoxy-1,4-benzoquinol methylase
MSQPTEARPPTPTLFFETINAYQRTEALKGAIQLDVFTAIGTGIETAGALAQQCGTSERGMRTLCDYLVVIGFLTKEADRYRLTPDSAVFLDRRSPACLASSVTFLASPSLTDHFRDVAAIVRQGGTVASEAGTVAPEHPIWVEFARAMGPMMAMPAELLAQLVGAASGQQWKVLDIAAGHGLFGIALARQNPNAQIVALDWSNVLAVAQENARAAGLAGRYRTLPGSAFEVDYGGDYDLVLLTNFLHHFDVATCEMLLRKVHAALKPGGRAVALEFIPNEDRVSPPVAAAFSLMMLGSTPGGDAYTFSEYQRMFANAGFTRSEFHRLLPTEQQVVIATK